MEPQVKVDQVVRTARKTIALIVKRDATLVVRAPLHVTDAQISDLVAKKLGWIRTKQEQALATYPKVAPKEFVNGEGFWYLGKIYRLEIVDEAAAPLTLDDQFYLRRSALPQAAAVFEAWYRQQAQQVLSERAAWYAARTGLSYRAVKITAARTRWGSCSRGLTLSFAWRLVMAPMPVLDYVVIHELVHTEEKNHGRAFWTKLRAIMPDYRKQVEWLDVNGHVLRVG